ncbi:MAG TPA: metallopeptidase TldD-related protein [Terriglobia bacterium]|nr:metallopeptidase TldD-related protein [Terriglobia bacterium]
MATSSEILCASQADLQEIATDVVARAMKGGATAAEGVVREGSEFSTLVRLGQIETLKDAGSRAVGLRVFLGQKAASTYSSDFSLEGIERLVKGALELARVTSEDPYAGLPDPSQLGSLPGDLDLYHGDVYALPPAERIEYARRAETAALEADPRIKNSDGGSFDASNARKVLANSLGFLGDYRRSYCSVSASPIACDENGAMQRDYWYSSARTLARMESPESVGRRAAERTVRRLGARKIPSTRVPLVFDSETAQSLLQSIFDAVNGDAIYRQSSFLEGKLGKKVAAESITIVDDGTIPGGFGTSPFDGEGVPSRRTVVIERGVLKSYLLNTYTARRLGLETTGNGARGLAGTPGIGYNNFFLQKGSRTAEQIISDIKHGLYVIDLLGFGVNTVTGDYSRGATGIWIENGELTYAVEEITVAGNLQQMLHNISEVGSDLEFRSAISCPTLRIDGMTIAGQ